MDKEDVRYMYILHSIVYIYTMGYYLAINIYIYIHIFIMEYYLAMKRMK